VQIIDCEFEYNGLLGDAGIDEITEPFKKYKLGGVISIALSI
jgi:hypothetical protein